ncbi:hypothetical protein [Agromyces sp. NPDC049794]|uniref:hypothetical protein n=1 Tax=unclassified Agromyces TaxID=2639701 RepID=UPI0033C500A6
MGTGHEDPRERRRDELRRIVYGTPGDPPDELVAELVELEEDLARPHRPVAGEGQATDGSDRPSGAVGTVWADRPLDPIEAVEWRPPSRRRRSPRRVLATSAAVVAAAMVMLGPVRDALAPPEGLEIFERAQTDEERRSADEVATDARLDPYAPEALRSLGRLFGYGFWAYREDGLVCMLSQRPYFFDWEESCATLDAFRESELTQRIGADTIRDGSRPRRFHLGDIVVVGWGPTSIELEWRLEPAS